jgi:hypothetical protein
MRRPRKTGFLLFLLLLCGLALVGGGREAQANMAARTFFTPDARELLDNGNAAVKQIALV